ncbi:MAG: hypothetical protein JWM47_369 [Acidimicrobiales bacterium]|nr:hypothetical protein [Acidimicrobiales bacterium]
MRLRTHALPLVLLAAVSLSACGGSDAATPTTAVAPVPTGTAAPGGTAAGAGVAVKSSSTELGRLLVGPDGKTMYGFTNDPEGVSSCSGTCAEAWPPVIVAADWKVGPELDSGIFSTVSREDGTQQLAVGRWPLYYYSNDAVAGDVNGQGSGGVWFVAGADGKLIEDDGPAPGDDPAPGAGAVKVAETSLGKVLVDGKGLTLYAFLPDQESGLPTCKDACAKAWPPATVDGTPEVGEGIEPSLVTTVDGASGGTQLKAGTWPLYTFSGDAAPGDVNGQGSGGSWFVLGADAKLIKGDGGGGGTPDAPPASTTSVVRPSY